MEIDALSLPDFNYRNMLLAQKLDVDNFELNIGHNFEVTMRKPYSGAHTTCHNGNIHNHSLTTSITWMSSPFLDEVMVPQTT